jgi:hypothetical protein
VKKGNKDGGVRKFYLEENNKQKIGINGFVFVFINIIFLSFFTLSLLSFHNQ